MRFLNRFDPARTKEPINRTLLVGPGSYNPRLPEFTLPHSMAGRHKQSNNPLMTVPGPGEYCPEKVLNYLYPPLAKSISSSVPEIKQNVPKNTPGPGAHDPQRLDKIPGPKIMPQTKIEKPKEEKSIMSINNDDEKSRMHLKAKQAVMRYT